MSLYACFVLVVAVGSILITGALVYVHNTFPHRNSFREESRTAYTFNGNEEMSVDFTASRMTGALPTLKPFLYLTQTEECLPSNLASSIGYNETCNCDVIVLSYQTECTERRPSHVTYMFDPRSTWGSGRNMLYFTALGRSPGYHYYIFIDDDATLTFNDFTPPEMKKVQQPFRAVEEWLLDYEPAVGVLDYTVHHGARWTFERKQLLCDNKEFSLVLPTVCFDAIFHAFHYKAIGHILPYETSYDEQSWWASELHIMSVLELKFRGQALLFVPVTVENPKHRDYPRSIEHFDAKWRTFIEQIQQEAPTVYKNQAIFKQFKEGLMLYTLNSSTYCMKVTRHLPIMPYAHFRRDETSQVK
ncbi:hypothetical protein OS493_001549 [Desmophyllum pertusum]|uniref:Uncharacterized protein n=1 Tax=Desmophyllum pertusum TaxID=174260 RepID=A0A9W9ZK03_9CNID|nr:hypothetical protein OS493_001549 [Desmophyllum pertusum]